MLAVTIPRFGSAEVLTLAELPDPVPGVGEALIFVAAAGVNRSDLGQRQGNYPPRRGPRTGPVWRSLAPLRRSARR